MTNMADNAQSQSRGVPPEVEGILSGSMETNDIAFAEEVKPALIRAAVRAYELSLQTNTPFVVCRNGKIIDLITNTEIIASPSGDSLK
jgi:hypothetical protein